MRNSAPLAAWMLLHGALLLTIWFSGSLWGSWPLECSVGTIAWDLRNGLNPLIPLHDYYDNWTTGYLVAALASAPFQLLFDSPAAATKAMGLLWSLATLGLTWTFLLRNVGRRAALWGTGLMAAPPPLLLYYNLGSGNYHYTEILFDLLVALIAAELGTRRWSSARAWAGLGLAAGLAVTNCYGSAVFAGAAVLWLWLRDRRTPLRLAPWAALPGLALGLAPWLYKLTLHAPYGLDSGPVLNKGLYVRPSLQSMLGEVARLPADYAAHLAFQDGLVRWLDIGQGLAAGQIYALLVAWAGAIGLWHLRQRPASVLPALFAVALTVVIIVSNQEIEHLEPALSQFRDSRFLPPLVAFAAIAAGVGAETLGRRGAPMILAPALLISLLATTGAVEPRGRGDGEGIAYRGRCYVLQGLYASAYFDELPAGQPSVPWSGPDVCAGFPLAEQRDCQRGRIWGVGLKHLDHRAFFEGARASSSLLTPEGVRICEALDGPWRADCWRQAGWAAATMARTGHYGVQAEATARACLRTPSAQESGWCLEGYGFHLADHYGWAPGKLRLLVPADRFTREARLHMLRGAGILIALQFEGPAAAERACARYGELLPSYEAACREGLQLAADVGARPAPW